MKRKRKVDFVGASGVSPRPFLLPWVTGSWLDENGQMRTDEGIVAKTGGHVWRRRALIGSLSIRTYWSRPMLPLILDIPPLFSGLRT